MAIPSWLTVTPMSGDHNGSLSVKAASHTGREPRSAVITGTTSHSTVKTISVSQNAAEEVVEITSVVYNGKTIEKTVNDFVIGSIAAKPSETTILITFSSNSKGIHVAGDTKLGSRFTTVKMMEKAAGPDISWNNDDTGLIPGDPGASAKYTYVIQLSGLKENQTESSIPFNLNLVNDTADGSDLVSSEEAITFTQSAGVKTYAAPVVSLSYADVPASGTSTSGVLYQKFSASQTWGWNGVSSGGGTITIGTPAVAETTFVKDAGTEAFAVSAAGAISGVASLGTTVKARAVVGSVKCVVKSNGVTGTTTATVYQAANSVTYGDIKFTPNTGPGTGYSMSGDTTQAKVNATSTKGGTSLVSLFKTILQERTYTSGSSAGDQLNTADNWTGTDPIIKATQGVAVPGFTFTSPSKVDWAENYSNQGKSGYKITVTVTRNGKTGTYIIEFTQAAGGSTIEFNPTSLTFEAAGSTKTVTVTSNDTWTIS